MRRRLAAWASPGGDLHVGAVTHTGPVQYQERFSETHGAEMYDAASRELKAAKVIAILEDALRDLGALRLLDLG